MAALTYRNEILFFDLSNNTLNENSKGFHQYAFKEPIIDFCWNDQRGLLILSTTRNPFKLLFLNGKMQNFPAFALFEESIKSAKFYLSFGVKKVHFLVTKMLLNIQLPLAALLTDVLLSLVI